MATEGSRTAAGFAAFALLAAGITAAVLAAGSSTPAGAADLARFASCEDLRAWSVDVGAPAVLTDGIPVDVAEADGDAVASTGGAATGAPAGAAPPAAATFERTASEGEGADTGATGASDDAGESGGTGGTNTVVEGVDEIDVVDRLPGDRALVARNGALAVVDLTGPTVLSHVGGLPHDARISVDGEVVWAAGSARDGSGVAVQRLRLAGDTLQIEGEWRTPGYLVDARRSGDTLYVVAVDQPQTAGALPFEGGPVPCDQVWFPEAGADTPAATLLVGLPATGDLAPTGAAEVVGSGSGFLVTGSAAYVTTQSWADQVATGVHRFDLASLQPTGSGEVPGAVPGPFGLNEHEGHLRVATSAQGTGIAVGRPIEGDAVGVDDAVDAGISRPADPPQSFGGPLAEVFVLDLDGALDVVGRSGRFGHDGETIHGVRFVGDTAYVVTFLQTDPFWVLDLTDPATPRIVGELQIPGFSGYLHPVGDGHVVGFGPDGNGRMAARLFDVSDPAAPSVVDEVGIGDDTPVAWDYHAFVSLGDTRFAVPATTYPRFEERCAQPTPQPQPVPLPEPLPEPEPEPQPQPEPVPEPVPVEPGIGGGQSSSEPLPPVCETTVVGDGSTGALVLEVRGDELAVVDEAFVETDGSLMAERVLPTEAGGWVLLGWDRLVAVDGGQAVLPAG